MQIFLIVLANPSRQSQDDGPIITNRAINTCMYCFAFCFDWWRMWRVISEPITKRSYSSETNFKSENNCALKNDNAIN